MCLGQSLPADRAQRTADLGLVPQVGGFILIGNSYDACSCFWKMARKD